MLHSKWERTRSPAALGTVGTVSTVGTVGVGETCKWQGKDVHVQKKEEAAAARRQRGMLRPPGDTCTGPNPHGSSSRTRIRFINSAYFEDMKNHFPPETYLASAKQPHS